MDIINALSEDVSFEEAMYSLYVANNIRKGIEVVEVGRVFTQNDMKELFVKEVE